MTDVSVITSAYNSERFISQMICSVLNQTFSNWELIIVDDNSSDNTVKIVQSYANTDRRIRCIKLKRNVGSGLARNKAIAEAKGRYIAFLDSDDLWKPNKLEVQLKYMISNSYSFTYSSYDRINDRGETIGHMGIPDRVSYNDLLRVCSIGCLTVIYDTKAFGKVYMPSIRKRQDLALWLKLLTEVEYAHGLNESLAQYRVHRGSISANKYSAAKHTWRLYRDQEQLNFLLAVFYFTQYAFNGMIRTRAPQLARLLGILK